FIVAREPDAVGALGAESLYTVDTSTGQATQVGPLGLAADGNVGSLAIAPSGILYGIVETAIDGPSPASAMLYTINTTTGAATPVGPLGTVTIVTGMAFGATGTLWYSGLVPAAQGVA